MHEINIIGLINEIMNKDFSFFTISIFDGIDFDTLSEVVSQIENKDLESNIVTTLTTIPKIEDYFNPPAGGSHFPQFCIWKNHNYLNKVFFISNYQDGLYSLCNAIHLQTKGNLIMCSLSNESCLEHPFFHFHYSNSKFIERDVLAYKEDKWIFYETGTPLDIENIHYYKNRMIKKRLNNTIIEEYLLKLGINLWNADSSIDKTITYKQLVWNPI
jgi:hypothetical protein